MKTRLELLFIGFILIFLVVSLLFLSLNKSKDFKKEILSPNKIVVVDGDTVKFKEGNKFVYLRIVGIDTPEYKKKQKEFVIEHYHVKNVSCLDKYGVLAKKRLEDLIKNAKNVTIIIYKKDPYGRYLGKLIINNSIDVAEILVKEGYAFLFTKDNYYKQYEDELYYSKEHKLGLWSCIG